MTAQAFRAAIERAVSPRLGAFAPALPAVGDIVGVGAYHAGKAAHISGVAAERRPAVDHAPAPGGRPAGADGDAALLRGAAIDAGQPGRPAPSDPVGGALLRRVERRGPDGPAAQPQLPRRAAAAPRQDRLHHRHEPAEGRRPDQPRRRGVPALRLRPGEPARSPAARSRAPTAAAATGAGTRARGPAWTWSRSTPATARSRTCACAARPWPPSTAGALAAVYPELPSSRLVPDGVLPARGPLAGSDAASARGTRPHRGALLLRRSRAAAASARSCGRTCAGSASACASSRRWTACAGRTRSASARTSPS